MELIQQTVAGMVIYLRGFPLEQEERFTEIKLAFLDKAIVFWIKEIGILLTE